MNQALENAMSLHTRLDTLRAEHRELDDTLSRLCLNPADDELVVRRIKKRRLMLRDRISLIERLLGGNSPA